jgi:putative DNA primase/helicase
MNPILDAALDYAAQGWPVLAIKAGTKQPRDPAVNGGPRWNATTDLEAISKRWGIAEPPGIGIACGIASGLLVIDIDTEDGHGVDGPASLAELEAKHGPLPATVEAKTPSGGRHLYFRYPKDREVRNGTSVIGRGIDHRGEGGYVVAAPTKRPDGAYRWFKSPDDCKICDCPTWLLDLMAPESPQETHTATQGDSSAPLDSQVIDCESPEPPQSPSEVSAWAEAALRDEVTKLWATPEGQRNHALNTAAFNLSQIIEGGGLDRNRVEAELRATALEIGLTNDEIGKTIRSGFEAGAKEPRHSK